MRAAGATLRAAGIDSGRADAARLAAHLLDCPVGEVERLAILGRPAPAGFTELVTRRARREPLQHLTGRAPFRHLDLHVGPGVFVPRPETETLVDLALTYLRGLPSAPPPRIVDLCTGSGAIALTIADEHPVAVVGAVELSEAAHAYARRNVDAHADRLGERGTPAIDLRRGDASSSFLDWAGTIDLVATNPPYIPDDAIPRDREVRDHDPHLALFGGGADGLDVPRALLAHAAHLLRPGGALLMEHGETQGQQLAELLGAAGGWVDIADHRDATDRPRVICARRART
nr:peptide chain release factor N(5)-glutamine methyltransferase [Kineosphaera limosa]